MTNLIGVPLGEGASTVTHFAPDGRSGLVVVGSVGGAGRNETALIMLPRLEPARGWDVVGISDRDTGRVTPAPPVPAGEAAAIGFARAKIGGTPVTLMFVAHRGGLVGRLAPVTIDTYRLSTDGEDGSGLPAVFDPIATRLTRGDYCTPRAALVAEADLPPSPGQPFATRDGCGGDAAS